MSMGRRCLLILCVSLLLPWSAPAEEHKLPDAATVVAHLDRLYRSEYSYAKLHMQIKTKHFDRTLEIESWTAGKEKALMVIRKPAREAGVATLRTPEGLWNYVPRADRLVRIPTSLLSESWMGSHFTNDDLVRDSSLIDDFVATLDVRDKEPGRLFVTLVPKPEAPVVYTKAVFVLDLSQWTPIRTDWYDGSAIVRTTQYSEPRSFSGRILPAKMTVIPADAPGEFTSITYKALDFSQRPSDSVFEPRGLRRAARRR